MKILYKVIALLFVLGYGTVISLDGMRLSFQNNNLCAFHQNSGFQNHLFSSPLEMMRKQWRELGVFEPENLKVFITNPRIKSLFSSWYEIQHKKKIISFYGFHHHLEEFYLEEEMRKLLGKESVKIMQDEQIYSKLAWFLISLKEEEKHRGVCAVQDALSHLEQWYCPLINVSPVEERNNEINQECSYCSTGDCCYYLFDALD